MIRLILLTDFTEAFAHNLLRGILEYSKGKEPWVVCRMPPSYKEQHGIEGVLEWAKKWEADAIIARFDTTDNVDLFKQNGIIALAQDFKSLFTNIPNITSQYVQTGEMAAKFFIEKGFETFAFLGYENVVWSEERCNGFRDYILKHVTKDNYYEYRKQSLEYFWYYEPEPLINWIKELPKPIALMACDDNQANKVMEICRILNIKIPEEIAVLGVDNDETMCGLSNPPLSSISLNIEKGGYEAAEFIEQLLKNKDTVNRNIVIEPITIINRQSTDIYATKDKYVLKVLKYIHHNLSGKLSVDDVVQQVPMSRRLMEIRFKQVTGNSIYQYITNLRMSRFSQLLLSSNDSIANIAAEVGLMDSKNLSRQFKEWKGCTPLEYRKRYKERL